MKTIVLISFYSDRIPGGADAFLSATQCGRDVAEVKEFGYGKEGKITVKVTLTLDEGDERIAKVRALLAQYGEEEFSNRRDIYTEEDLQSARLLRVGMWIDACAFGGPRYGTTYDMSKACPTCGTGARQTSPLIVGETDLRTVDRHRVAATTYDDLLIRDTDVERLLAANVTGAVFWPASVKRKSGEVDELRWQQAVIEHVLPPMAAGSLLERKDLCSTCHRGGFTAICDEPLRVVYRAADLKHIEDFNLTWEWLGVYTPTAEEIQQGYRRAHPQVLVTPKVMNLLRGKTKKEKKYEGVSFTPIWIEGETPQS